MTASSRDWRLQAEIPVLRHKLNALQQRAPRRLHLRWADRALFCLSSLSRILDTITIVRSETVVRWHRMRTKYKAHQPTAVAGDGIHLTNNTRGAQRS